MAPIKITQFYLQQAQEQNKALSNSHTNKGLLLFSRMGITAIKAKYFAKHIEKGRLEAGFRQHSNPRYLLY